MMTKPKKKNKSKKELNALDKELSRQNRKRKNR